MFSTELPLPFCLADHQLWSSANSLQLEPSHSEQHERILLPRLHLACSGSVRTCLIVHEKSLLWDSEGFSGSKRHLGTLARQHGYRGHAGPLWRPVNCIPGDGDAAHTYKRDPGSWANWPTPVIPHTWEVEGRVTGDQSQPGWHSKTLSQTEAVATSDIQPKTPEWQLPPSIITCVCFSRKPHALPKSALHL